jgi:hypothetical protein
MHCPSRAIADHFQHSRLPAQAKARTRAFLHELLIALLDPACATTRAASSDPTRGSARAPGAFALITRRAHAGQHHHGHAQKLHLRLRRGTTAPLTPHPHLITPLHSSPLLSGRRKFLRDQQRRAAPRGGLRRHGRGIGGGGVGGEGGGMGTHTTSACCGGTRGGGSAAARRQRVPSSASPDLPQMKGRVERCRCCWAPRGGREAVAGAACRE